MVAIRDVSVRNSLYFRGGRAALDGRSARASRCGNSIDIAASLASVVANRVVLLSVLVACVSEGDLGRDIPEPAPAPPEAPPEPSTSEEQPPPPPDDPESAPSAAETGGEDAEPPVAESEANDDATPAQPQNDPSDTPTAPVDSSEQ